MFHLGAGSENILQVRTYFYPRWTAKADDRQLPVTANADGLLLISVPPQATDIQLVFEQPKRVPLFEVVTVMSWMLILGFLALAAIKMRRLRGTDPDSP